MMTRVTTWSNLGTEADSNNLDDLFRAADLNYTAIARDLYTEDKSGEKILIPGKKMIVREDTDELFGIVTDRYKICQNRDALDFVNYIDGVELERAGSHGGYVYLIAKMPEVTVLGDTIRPHLIFQNSHDGSCSIKATICMLRLVCQNQFVRSFSESPATISITHQGNMEEKIAIAQSTMSDLYNYIKQYNDEAEKLVTKKVSPQKFNAILNKFFAIDKEATPRQIERIEYNRDTFIQAYNADDNQNFKGTQWGLVNAYSDYITHYEPTRKTSSYEINNFMWSLSNRPMDDFIKFVTNKAA